MECRGRKAAPVLRLRVVGVKVCIKPNAFGNALGSSLAEQVNKPSDAERQAYLAADQMRAGHEDAAAYAR